MSRPMSGRMSREERTESYSQIIRSSSIIGGGQVFNYAIGLIRIKIIAVLLGPSGVGLISLFTLITELVGSFMRFGIAQSAVREIAEANGRDDSYELAATTTALRRACLVSGVFAWALTAILAYPLSQWTFSSTDHTWPIAVLGLALLFTIMAEGQTALLQGTRRVELLAKVSIVSAILTTVVSISLYAAFDQEAIMAVLIVSAAITFAVSWWYASRVELNHCMQDWNDTWQRTRKLLQLGFAFMWSTFMAAFAALTIRTIIVRDLGVEANGLYQAAWALSSIFGSVLVGAMSTDYYPRLTALIEQKEEAAHLVNEQIEIGILIALPGMMATILLSEWIVVLFYSGEFTAAAPLLQCLVFSVFFTLISYPMGYILVAAGAAKRYAFITTAFHLLHIAGVWFLSESWGLKGIAALNAALGMIYVFGMRALVGPVIDFKWRKDTLGMMTLSTLLLVTGIMLTVTLDPKLIVLAGILFSGATAVFSLRGIAKRVGPEHRIVQFVSKLPFGRQICGMQ